MNARHEFIIKSFVQINMKVFIKIDTFLFDGKSLVKLDQLQSLSMPSSQHIQALPQQNLLSQTLNPLQKIKLDLRLIQAQKVAIDQNINQLVNRKQMQEALFWQNMNNPRMRITFFINTMALLILSRLTNIEYIGQSFGQLLLMLLLVFQGISVFAYCGYRLIKYREWHKKKQRIDEQVKKLNQNLAGLYQKLKPLEMALRLLARPPDAS